MNQNRCCPGVPNMYSTRSFSRVMRPKSIATGGVFWSGTWERSSTSVEATVMTASVVSGVISDTEPTKVVLPTPKPPATTILTDAMAAAVASSPAALELAKSTEHPLEQVKVRGSRRVIGLGDPDQTVHRHVRDQHAGHAQGHPEHRRDLCDRPPVTAEPENDLAFRAERGEIAGLIVGGRHHRFDLELSPRLGSSPGNRVGTDQGT